MIMLCINLFVFLLLQKKVCAYLPFFKRHFFVDFHQCLCEVPESYEAYRKQQHRWHSGPMQLFRLCLPDIITAKVS